MAAFLFFFFFFWGGLFFLFICFCLFPPRNSIIITEKFGFFLTGTRRIGELRAIHRYTIF